MSASAEVPAVGTVLAGRYRVERTVGLGGMGMVLAVRHLELGTTLAMKLLRPHVLKSSGAVERFLREARAASAIQSEHVARVTDFGRLRDGTPFMILELLQGEDLARRIARNGAMTVTAAVDMVLQACEALAEAHVLGIVHRDLKPANLFLHQRRDGSEMVKVLDFGISKVATPTEVHLTTTTAMLGSPLYMSPEQLRSAKVVDARTDIWALGTILYEATTGDLPFAANTVAELAIIITNDEPPPMLQVPSEFASVVLRCLAKKPADRFPDVGALAEALRPFASELQRASVHKIGRILTAPAPAATPANEPSEPSDESSSDVAAIEPRRSTTNAILAEPRDPSGRRVQMLGAGIGFAVVGAALSIGVWWRMPHEPKHPTPAPTQLTSIHSMSAPLPTTSRTSEQLASTAVSTPSSPEATASAASVSSDAGREVDGAADMPPTETSGRALVAQPPAVVASGSARQVKPLGSSSTRPPTRQPGGQLGAWR